MSPFSEEDGAQRAPLAFGPAGIDRPRPSGVTLWEDVEMQRPVDVTTKADARSLVVKLMDYYIVFAEMIGASFEQATFVNLTRHPYGQCESLMRSGLSLEDACRWYDDVARMMAEQANLGAIAVRFEDVVTRPIETCDRLYRSLGVRWSEDGKFEFKVKPYGTDRVADVGVEDRDFIRIGAQDASQQIDASVLRGETERLSDAQRRAVWELTGATAALLGYGAAGSLRNDLTRAGSEVSRAEELRR